jgi:hypothetical protein
MHIILGLLLIVTQTATESPDALIRRAAAAHGNRWTTGEITDWVAEGKVTFHTTEGPKPTFDVTLMRKGGLAVQRIVKQPGGEVRQGSDGVRSWESFNSLYTPSAQGMALHFIESQTIRAPQRLFNHGREGLTLREGESVGRNRVIEATDGHGQRTNYSIDRDTATVTRLDFVAGKATDPFSGAEVDVIDGYAFSDYRMVQGVLTPFKIERFINNQKIEEMQFSSVRYNAGLKDQDFRR